LVVAPSGLLIGWKVGTEFVNFKRQNCGHGAL